jgi:hypothetical protein
MQFVSFFRATSLQTVYFCCYAATTYDSYQTKVMGYIDAGTCNSVRYVPWPLLKNHSEVDYAPIGIKFFAGNVLQIFHTAKRKI